MKMYRWCPEGVDPMRVPSRNTPRQYGRGLYFAPNRASADTWLGELEHAASQRGEEPIYVLHEIEIDDNLMEINALDFLMYFCEYMRVRTKESPNFGDMWDEYDYWMLHPIMDAIGAEATECGVCPTYSVSGYVVRMFVKSRGFEGMSVKCPEGFKNLDEVVLFR